MSIYDNLKNRIKNAVGESAGTAGDNEFAGLMDPTPFESYNNVGMFKGRPGSKNSRSSNIFLYFKFPEDVKVEWTGSYRESADNQSFLTDLFNSLGSQLINKSTRAKKDTRMRFHIGIVREVSDKISLYDGVTPAQEDFLNRFGGFDHPIWHSYLGVELQVGSIHQDVYTTKDKVRNWYDYMTSEAGDIDYKLYRESFMEVTEACLDVGMRPLDFKANPEDFYRLTAWFGEDDPVYDIQPDLSTTTLALPEHNKSIFVAGTEMTFSAIRPKQGRDPFDKNPLSSTGINFGKALLTPSLNIAHINIRGEIRSPEAASTLFDDRLTKGEYKEESGSNDTANKSVAEKVKARKDMSRAEIFAEQSGQLQYAWLDNCEITVARIVDGQPSELNKRLNPFDLEAVNVVERQQIALASTVPCYPNSIFKVPASDKQRNPNVNNFYSGILSLSGLFRSTKPCGPGGVLLGLSDSGYEFKEIFIETNASNKYSAPPTILLTGSTGSGKALPLDSNLIKPDGSMIKMGDVKVGDTLLSPDGTSTKVTYVTPIQKDHSLVEMVLADNQKHISDYNHQWIVKENVPYYVNGESIDLVDRLLSFDDGLENLYSYIESNEHPYLDRNTLINSYDMYMEFKELGANTCHFNNSRVIEASLNFVGIQPRSSHNEEKRWNILEAIAGMRERISQRLETISWRDDDPQLTRLTSLEMLHGGILKRPSSGAGSKIPKFSIVTSLPIEFEESVSPEIDPLVAGFILTSSPTKTKNGIQPKYNWGVGNVSESLSQISSRQYKAISDCGYDIQKGVFGSIIISKEDIENIKEKVLDYSGKGVNLNYKFSKMSISDRKRFIQGLVDGCSTFSTSRQKFTINVPSALIEVIANIIRSLGIPVYVSNNKSEISFFLKEILIGDNSPVKNPDVVENSENIIPISEISEYGTGDVKCIQVDNEYSSYLVEGFVPTSNTVEALMIAAQFRYIGQQVIYINPKPKSSLKPFFDMLGGQTISMSTAYLKENPGLLDPMFFLESREDVARLLTDMIIRSRRMTQDMGSGSSDQMENLRSEIMERADMPANECSYDIIFGNRRHGASTPRLGDDDIVEFVRNKMDTSPVWKAIISKNPDERSRFQKLFNSGAPLLIEWDRSIVLPDESQDPTNWTPDEIDSIQSVVNIFDYASDTIGNGRKGGILIVDESQVLRNSEVVMNKVKNAGAMWRASNINLLLATQNISTFAGGKGNKHDLSPYIRLFIMMKTTDDELEHFYRITGLPKDTRHSDYMRNAGINKAGGQKKSLPNAFILDRTYKWSGGIICGPFPQRELSAALEDRESLKAREEALKELEYQNLMGESYDIENDEEALKERIREQENKTSFG